MTTHNFRPQNSRHEDPVQQEHAVQYIANPMCTWYVLREKYPEQYEAAVDLPPDEWFHVKVVVSGAKAEVFVNDDDTPCLTVEDLKHGLSRGPVGWKYIRRHICQPESQAHAHGCVS